MVLSKLDSIKGMKILFSFEGTGHPELLHPKSCREYYIIYNDNNIYKEYVVITDSISNIAARYKMTYAAVSMELNRLRTKLHNYLTERGYEL